MEAKMRSLDHCQDLAPYLKEKLERDKDYTWQDAPYIHEDLREAIRESMLLPYDTGYMRHSPSIAYTALQEARTQAQVENRWRYTEEFKTPNYYSLSSETSCNVNSEIARLQMQNQIMAQQAVMAQQMAQQAVMAQQMAQVINSISPAWR